LDPKGGFVDTIEKYVAVAVILLFVAGISLLVIALRQQNRTRKQWGSTGSDRMRRSELP